MTRIQPRPCKAINSSGTSESVSPPSRECCVPVAAAPAPLLLPLPSSVCAHPTPLFIFLVFCCQTPLCRNFPRGRKKDIQVEVVCFSLGVASQNDPCLESTEEELALDAGASPRGGGGEKPDSPFPGRCSKHLHSASRERESRPPTLMTSVCRKPVLSPS